MGEGPSHTLSEIAAIRSSLDAKVTELERRLPAAVEMGRKALKLAASGGAAGTALLVLKKVRSRGKGQDGKRAAAPASTVVVNNVLPKGVVPLALGAFALWAAVRLYEARLNAGAGSGERTRPAVVTPMPSRASGA